MMNRRYKGCEDVSCISQFQDRVELGSFSEHPLKSELGRHPPVQFHWTQGRIYSCGVPETLKISKPYQ
jgi:hypothetical protein